MTETAAEAAARECRECRAGAAQARGMDLAWRCMEHGVVRLNDYESASHDAAVRALVEAAKDVVVLHHAGFIGSDVTPEQNEIIRERARRFGEALAPFLERERARDTA